MQNFRLLLVLLKLSRGKVKYIYKGICWHVTGYDKQNILPELFQSWPKFSGNKCYPVPDPESKCPSHTFWHRGILGPGLWDGEYGELRKELALHLYTEVFKRSNKFTKWVFTKFIERLV